MSPVSSAGPPVRARLADDLARLLLLANGRALPVAHAVAAMEDRGSLFGVLFLALPFVLPIPSLGMALPIGSFLAMAGLAMARGGTPSLPAFLQRREIAYPALRALAGAADRAKGLVGLLRPRLTALTSGPARAAIGLSLFCAAWTVGSMKQLTEAEVASATYYETTGWRGILERDRGSPMPDRFPSLPGMVFPVYHIFAFLADRQGARAIEARSSDPSAVEALAFRTPAGIRLMVANLTSDVRRVAVGGLAGKRVAVTPLNDGTARTAFDDPRALGSHSSVQAVNEDLVLELRPFAVAFISETRAAE